MDLRIKDQDRKIKDLLTICSTTTGNKSKKSRKKVKVRKLNHEPFRSLEIKNVTGENSADAVKKIIQEKSPGKNQKYVIHNCRIEDDRRASNGIVKQQNETKKKRIFIVADQQGRGLQ